jgi:glutathione S-transferase
MTLELYNFPPSTCSLKARIALAEKNLKWVDHRLLSKDNDHLKPAYLKLNPNGVVPTLVHESAVITESSVILEYLDEVFADVKLTPSDPVERAKMRAWLRFAKYLFVVDTDQMKVAHLKAVDCHTLALP